MAICIILGLIHALRNANVEGWQVSSLVFTVFGLNIFYSSQDMIKDQAE